MFQKIMFGIIYIISKLGADITEFKFKEAPEFLMDNSIEFEIHHKQYRIIMEEVRGTSGNETLWN